VLIGLLLLPEKTLLTTYLVNVPCGVSLYLPE